MGLLTNYTTTELVDHVFKAASTRPTTVYLALCTNTLTVADVANTDLTETSYTNYVRTAITFGAAASRKVIQNADVDFPQAGSTSSSDITNWAICTSASGVCDVLAFGTFNSSWNLESGNTPSVVSGEVEIEIGASGTAGFTNGAVHDMLNFWFRNTAWTSPSTSIHFGLATADLTDSSTSATEPSGNNYAREPVAAASFNAASSGVTASNADIEYDIPTGSWGTIETVPIFSALSGGDLLAYQNITGQAVTTDDVVKVVSGAFTCDLD